MIPGACLGQLLGNFVGLTSKSRMEREAFKSFGHGGDNRVAVGIVRVNSIDSIACNLAIAVFHKVERDLFDATRAANPDRAAIQRFRYRPLMGQQPAESSRPKSAAGLNFSSTAGQPVESAETVDFFPIADARSLEVASKDG